MQSAAPQQKSFGQHHHRAAAEDGRQNCYCLRISAVRKVKQIKWMHYALSDLGCCCVSLFSAKGVSKTCPSPHSSPGSRNTIESLTLWPTSQGIFYTSRTMQTGLTIQIFANRRLHRALLKEGPTCRPEHCRDCRCCIAVERAVTTRRSILASSTAFWSTVPLLVVSGGQTDAGQVTPYPITTSNQDTCLCQVLY